MSYVGLDFGRGLENFSSLMEEGYKARLALQQREEQMRLAQAAQQYGNLLKQTQVESEAGPLSGMMDVPSYVVKAPNNLQDFFRAGAAEGEAVKPQTSTVSPRPPGEIKVTPIKKDEKRGPGSEGEVIISAPTDLDPVIVERIRQVGGHITPEGRIRVPNYIGRQMWKAHETYNQAMANSFLAGARGAAAPDRYVPIPGAPAGKTPPGTDKSRKYKDAIAQLNTSRKGILAGAGLKANIKGYNEIPEPYRGRVQDIDMKIKQLEELQMLDLGAGVAKEAVKVDDKEAKWLEYLQKNPRVRNSQENKTKYLQSLGGK